MKKWLLGLYVATAASLAAVHKETAGAGSTALSSNLDLRKASALVKKITRISTRKADPLQAALDKQEQVTQMVLAEPMDPLQAVKLLMLTDAQVSRVIQKVMQAKQRLSLHTDSASDGRGGVFHQAVATGAVQQVTGTLAKTAVEQVLPSASSAKASTIAHVFRTDTPIHQRVGKQRLPKLQRRASNSSKLAATGTRSNSVKTPTGAHSLPPHGSSNHSAWSSDHSSNGRLHHRKSASKSAAAAPWSSIIPHGNSAPAPSAVVTHSSEKAPAHTLHFTAAEKAALDYEPLSSEDIESLRVPAWWQSSDTQADTISHLPVSKVFLSPHLPKTAVTEKFAGMLQVQTSTKSRLWDLIPQDWMKA
jgi:hypothetical protein